VLQSVPQLAHKRLRHLLDADRVITHICALQILQHVVHGKLMFSCTTSTCTVDGTDHAGWCYGSCGNPDAAAAAAATCGTWRTKWLADSPQQLLMLLRCLPPLIRLLLVVLLECLKQHHNVA
jgi:hypothetical protein